MTPMIISGAEVSAWSAVVLATAALGTQVVNGIRKARKEKEEIDEALDRAPEVRHQLELGNVGEAVKHLNVIIESQAAHIRAQEDRQKSCDTKIEHLSSRVDAAEAEAEGWENKYRQAELEHELDRQAADRQISELKQEIQELRKSFARTIAQLRSDNEPGEMT